MAKTWSRSETKGAPGKIALYLAAWHPKAWTVNLYIDAVMSTPPELGWMMALILRVQLINAFNILNPQRDYCREFGSWRDPGGSDCKTGQCETAYKYSPPEKRHFNFELVGAWAFSGFQFELGIRWEGDAENNVLS